MASLRESYLQPWQEILSWKQAYQPCDQLCQQLFHLQDISRSCLQLCLALSFWHSWTKPHDIFSPNKKHVLLVVPCALSSSSTIRLIFSLQSMKTTECRNWKPQKVVGAYFWQAWNRHVLLEVLLVLFSEQSQKSSFELLPCSGAKSALHLAGISTSS